MPPKVRNQWRSRKIKLIAKFISDEIPVRKRVGMKCFITGKIPCVLWPSILKAAQEMAIREVVAILHGRNALRLMRLLGTKFPSRHKVMAS